MKLQRRKEDDPDAGIQRAERGLGSRKAALARRVKVLENYAAFMASLDGTHVDLDDILQRSVDQLEETTSAEGVFVDVLCGPEKAHRITSRKLKERLGLRITLLSELSSPITDQTVGLVCQDARADNRVDHEACQRVGVRSFLSAPIRGRFGPLGQLTLVAFSPTAFRPDDGETAALNASAFALALQNGAAPGSDDAFIRDALETATLAQTRLQAALQAAETRLQGLLTEDDETLVGFDETGEIIRWSVTAQTLFGWTQEDAIGQDGVSLFVPVRDQERRRAQLFELIQSNADDCPAGLQEWRAVKADGEEIPIELRLTRTPGGEKGAVTALVRDISRRRVETELFETAFHYAAIGKALVSLDGGFLKVNPALCTLTGYEAQELLALNFQGITHPDDLQEDVTLLSQLIAGEIPSYGLDKRYLRKDGQEVWAHLAVSLVYNKDGSPRHFISQIEDLTARRQAESALQESEARYRLIAENTSDVITTTTLDGHISFVSAACETVVGYKPERLAGVRALELCHPDDQEILEQVFARIGKGGPAERVRWRARHSFEDRDVWLESHPSIMRDAKSGRPTCFLDVIRDVTDQVTQEGALDKARSEAEAAVTAKTEFLANMSHEIRTPLTAVLGFTSLLSERPDLDDVARLHVHRVASASKALLAIVDDVLDFSKLDAGQVVITPEPTSPMQIVKDTLAMFAQEAEAKTLWLECDFEDALPALVMIDPDRVRQLLINLVGNAIKFTKAGSVQVALRYDHHLETLYGQVEDTGPGLSEAQQIGLFRRFSQLDRSTTRRHGGTGLGLAICKGLAEAMGGDIGVLSAPARGSTFFFEIKAPLAEGLVTLADPVRAPTPLAGVRVMVIDHRSANRDLARSILETAGVEVLAAEDGASGAELASFHPVDLILMGLSLPDMGGEKALEQIRGREGPNQDIPILAICGKKDGSRLGGHRRFDGVVRQPIAAEDLLAAVSHVTAWNHSQESEALDRAN